MKLTAESTLEINIKYTHWLNQFKKQTITISGGINAETKIKFIEICLIIHSG